MKIEDYIKFIKQLNNQGFLQTRDYENAHIIVKGNNIILLNEKGKEIINKISKKLETDFRKFGYINTNNLEKYFTDQNFNLLTNKNISDELIESNLLTFFSNLEREISSKCTIIIPITGLVLKGYLELQNFTIVSKRQLENKFKNDFIKNKIGRETFKDLLNSGDSFAYTIDIGEIKSLTNKQISALESALNLIRLYIPLFWDNKFDVQISVVNKDFVTVNSCYVLSSDELKHVSNTVVRKPLRFEIDKKRTHNHKYSQRKRMKLYNFENLNLIIKKENNISITLKNALHWMGLYTKEKNINLKFLYLIFCLESMFTNESNNYSSITASISEKVAFLTGKTLEKRLEIFNYVKDKYNKRSAIVHGSGKLVEVRELNTMFYIVLETFSNLSNFIQKYNITTFKDLNTQLTEIKFS